MKFGFHQFEKTDSVVIVGALCALLITMYCFFYDNSIFGLWQTTAQKQSNQPVVGKISYIENDTRHQQEGTFLWKAAENRQDIHLGDGVFTGSKSRSQVKLKDGGDVSLGENTLIVFRKIQGNEIPNLATGNFRLKVTGDMKIAIAGKITQIKGDNSEVQIVLNKKDAKPRIKLLQGTVKVQQEDSEKPIELKNQEEMAFLMEPTDEESIKELAAEIPIERIPAAEAAVAPPIEPKVSQKTSDETYVYIDQLYDFYDKKEDRLFKKAVRPNYVTLQKNITWEKQGDVKVIYGQHSESGDFKTSVFPFESQESEFKLSHVFLGENFVRLSLDNSQWDEIHKFTVEAKPLDVEAPKVLFERKEFALLDEPLKINGKLASSLSKFVVEVSRDPEFPVSATHILWLSKKEFNLKVGEEGSVYFKARAVNEKLELTSLSEIFKLDIYRPQVPVTPRIAKEKLTVFPNEVAHIDWSPVENAKEYSVSIKDENNNIIEDKIVKKRQFSWTAKKIGQYKMEVSSVDQYGQKSREPALASIKVKPELRPQVVNTADVAPRKPAAVETTVYSEMKIEDNSKTNAALSSSKFQFEGALFTMFGQEQNASPRVFALTGRVLNWWDANGFEGLVKSKVANASGSGDDIPSPFQIEARYHRRWNLPFNLLSASGGTQFSLIGGYEVYRNSAPGYSPGYDLFKAGFSVDFPVLQRWDTGGEVLYGYGSDKSTKYEIAGHINYYPKMNWSMGVGYRMHLFEAGSDKSAPPPGVPYREGYGEAYSALKWHY